MSRLLLLVEDEDSIREIARISLERVGGWAVKVARSGREAVELAAHGPAPRAVLLDVMMPGLDGPSTMAALKAGPLGEEVPFVFLTAKLQASDRARLEGLGAAGVIAKPFDPMGLSEELERVLGLERADEDVREGAQRIHAEFAELWRSKRNLFEARVRAVTTAAAGEDPSSGRRREAIAAAHMLSGSLGTFGLHRGGELARSLESGLRAGEPASRLQPLAVELAGVVATAAPEESPDRT